MDWEKLTRDFILNEGQQPSADIKMFIQNISETLDSIGARSGADKNRVQVAKFQLKEVLKGVRRLESRIQELEAEPESE